MTTKSKHTQFDAGFLVELLPTKTDVNEFAQQIETFLNSLFNVKQPLDEKIDSAFSTQKKRVLLACIKEFEINTKSKSAFEQDLRNLSKTAKEIPTVSITLAIEPDDRLISRISSWLLTNTSTPLVIDLTRKQSTIAGAVIGLDGKYYDYTLQNILKDTVAQRKSS